jgi:RecA-family ATPase
VPQLGQDRCQLILVANFHGLTLADFPDFHFASLASATSAQNSGCLRKTKTTFPTRKSLLRFDWKIHEYRAGLAILDTAAHFFGGEENKKLQVTQFIRTLDAISITRNCGMVFSRHPSFTALKEGRMSSGNMGWDGSPRSRIGMTAPKQPNTTVVICV